MRTIDREYSNTYIINKSKFLSFAYPISDTDEIEKILDKIRHEYNDATHICYAYILNSPASEKCSDDGEPNGTAGKPILELIKKKNIENVLVIVVRYFGGIKLGAGGLIRAYTTSAKEVIDRADIITAVLGYKCQVISDISNSNKLKLMLQSINVSNLKIQYLENVNFTFVIDDVSKLLGIDYQIIGREMYACN